MTLFNSYQQAADRAARNTGQEYVIVRVNGGELRLYSLEEFFYLPGCDAVELLYSTMWHKIQGRMDEEARQYLEHDLAYAHALKPGEKLVEFLGEPMKQGADLWLEPTNLLDDLKAEHQQSRRVGPADRRHHERGKLAKFFHDLFHKTPRHLLWVTVLIFSGLTTTGCSNPAEPSRTLCMDSWENGALVPGTCTEVAP